MSSTSPKQTMFDSIEVNVPTLLRAEQLWREQSQGAAQAAKVVADANTEGFDRAICADLETFFDTWSTVARQISTNVDDVTAGLEAFRNEFGMFESQTTETFTTFGSGFFSDPP